MLLAVQALCCSGLLLPMHTPSAQLIKRGAALCSGAAVAAAVLGTLHARWVPCKGLPSVVADCMS